MSYTCKRYRLISIWVWLALQKLYKNSAMLLMVCDSASESGMEKPYVTIEYEL